LCVCIKEKREHVKDDVRNKEKFDDKEFFGE
jgi:hypothetical protein